MATASAIQQSGRCMSRHGGCERGDPPSLAHHQVSGASGVPEAPLQGCGEIGAKRAPTEPLRSILRR
eukprot:1931695-Alexandrium_andersonii.AAC.1